MRRSTLLGTGALLLALPLAAPAQDGRHQPVPNRFEEKTFTLPTDEFARLWLDGGEVYRVEIDGTGISLRLAPIDAAHEPPRIQPLLLGRSASGTALYTVHVRDGGYYNLSAVGGEAGRVVTVRISEDDKIPKDTPKRTDRDSGATG
jgi:hypothetical protein